MKSIPVDVTTFSGFMCVEAPAPKSNPRTGEVRTDTATGLTVFVVGVVAIRPRDSSVIVVSVPGEPKGLSVGTALRLVGLEATPWDVDGRSGVSFKATAVVPAEPGETAGRRPVGVPATTAAGRGGESS